jgi:hypothetical protein
MDRFQIIRTKSGQAPFSVLYKKDDRMFASSKFESRYRNDAC